LICRKSLKSDEFKNSVVADKSRVLETWKQTIALRNKSVEAKGWTLDVLRCVDQINSNEFSLDEVYKFEEILKSKHPDNNFVKDKIRQQLQILRDMNVIEFISRGKYRKITK
jgi:type II restriction enzyme